jgi:hypothetical protein
LRVIGDGITARYQDREPGYVTLHGRSSVGRCGRCDRPGARTSPNSAFARMSPSTVSTRGRAKLAWPHARIGDVAFDAVNPVTRCLATHAHPITGRRDVPVMQTLQEGVPCGAAHACHPHDVRARRHDSRRRQGRGPAGLQSPRR